MVVKTLPRLRQRGKGFFRVFLFRQLAAALIIREIRRSYFFSRSATRTGTFLPLAWRAWDLKLPMSRICAVARRCHPLDP
jgi:hypothetical protein